MTYEANYIDRMENGFLIKIEGNKWTIMKPILIKRGISDHRGYRRVIDGVSREPRKTAIEELAKYIVLNRIRGNL